MLAAGPPQNSRSVQVAHVIASAGDQHHIGSGARDPTLTVNVVTPGDKLIIDGADECDYFRLAARTVINASASSARRDAITRW